MAQSRGRKARQVESEKEVVQAVRNDVTQLTDDDLYLFNEGTHYRLYQKLGAHPINVGGVEGTYFAVWAPSAKQVAVMGDFNGWTNPATSCVNGGNRASGRVSSPA